MKSIILTLFLSVILLKSHGQAVCGWIGEIESQNFEENDYSNIKFYIDTISNPNNIWQVGNPQKQIINSAFSTPKCIITDTINAYSPNDTSSFTIQTIDCGGWSSNHSAELSGKYFINSDTLNDFGLIEFSSDKGNSWINLLTYEDDTYYFEWHTPKPVLTGNSNGWIDFYLSYPGLGEALNVNYGDTILLKFSFISDDKVDSYDGLAFDDLQICNGVESGMESEYKNILSRAYPNPANNEIYIETDQTIIADSKLTIFNYLGEKIFEHNLIKESRIYINTNTFSSGLYFYKIINKKQKYESKGKFLIFK